MRCGTLWKGEGWGPDTEAPQRAENHFETLRVSTLVIKARALTSGNFEFVKHVGKSEMGDWRFVRQGLLIEGLCATS